MRDHQVLRALVKLEPPPVLKQPPGEPHNALPDIQPLVQGIERGQVRILTLEVCTPAAEDPGERHPAVRINKRPLLTERTYPHPDGSQLIDIPGDHLR